MSAIDRMRSDLEQGGYAKGTRYNYIAAVQRFLKGISKAPERVGVEDIRRYVEKLRTRKQSASWLKVEMAGIRYFFSVTLGRPQLVAWMRWPRQRTSLPVVLAGTEVVALLLAVSSPLYRAVITVMYAAGLRVSEACALEVGDIDSQRRVIHVRNGKRGRDRFVMLGDRLLTLLRSYWAANRPPKPLLFPGPDGSRPITPRSVREALGAAVARAGLKKRVNPHLLRHSFATHLLELGTDIRVIQHLLGHVSIRSTQLYSQVSRPTIAKVKSPLDVLGTEQGKALG
jgi:integrase/recombinase XerD